MRVTRWCYLAALMVSLVACGGQRTNPNNDPFATFNPNATASGSIPDFRPIYNKMGIVASQLPMAFVAQSAFFASQFDDSTLVVTTLSIPNRGLTFNRDGDEYVANYEVTLTASTQAGVAITSTTKQTVRVGTHKEVGRTDESIIFQKAFNIQPGSYLLNYTVKDLNTEQTLAEEELIHVPLFVNAVQNNTNGAAIAGTSTLSKPVVIYEATPRNESSRIPDYLGSPRSSLEFGVDSVIGVYIEAYNGGKADNTSIPMLLVLRDSGKKAAWTDTINMSVQNGIGTAIIDIPLAVADVGIWNLVAKRLDNQDSSRASVFVGFGPDLPVLTFNDMITYLRYFAPNSYIQKLYKATPETRGQEWAAFLRATDRSPATPQNEALQAYFLRIREANYQFRGEASEGWLSPRGSVYVGLGNPSAVYQDEGYLSQYSSVNSGQKVRILIWEYQDLQSRIIFVDELWSGQWRMLPASESQFRSLLSRVVSIR